MKNELTTPPDKAMQLNQDHNHLVKRHLAKKLVRELGGRHSSVLNINLVSMESGEVFKWYLASLLLEIGADETISIDTYKEFEKANVLSPEAIFQTGRQGLIDILNRGGYEGNQSRIASELLGMARNLIEKYDGDLNRLHFFAEDEGDLVRKLKGLKKEAGLVSIIIFLTELRNIWEKAEPLLLTTSPALVAARHLELMQGSDAETALEELRALLEINDQDRVNLSDLEVSLLRLGNSYCLNERCSLCPMSAECKPPEA